jgi:ParB-like chromosome segregation protein Spo0J
MLVDGHRRLAAAKSAGKQAVPCMAVRPGDEGRDTALMLAAAMHKALSPLERARAFERLRAEGLSVVQIAERTGYAGRTVSESLRLLLLPPDAQAMLAGKELTVAQATDLARQVAKSGTGVVAHHSTKKSTHLDRDHPLADEVRAACAHRDEQVVIGMSGCGRCWEAAIRADERGRVGASS